MLLLVEIEPRQSSFRECFLSSGHSLEAHAFSQATERQEISLSMQISTT